MSAILVTRLAAMFFAALFLLQLGNQSALACNRYDGCGREAMKESYDMMHSGRMTEAMAEGQANMTAFRAMQNRNSYYVAPGSAHKK